MITLIRGGGSGSGDRSFGCEKAPLPSLGCSIIFLPNVAAARLSAKSAASGVRLDVNSGVRVKAVEGLTLIVEPEPGQV